jgi:hypothetical protein
MLRIGHVWQVGKKINPCVLGASAGIETWPTNLTRVIHPYWAIDYGTTGGRAIPNQ